MNVISKRIVMLAGAIVVLALAVIALMATQSLVVFGQDFAPGSSVKLTITAVNNRRRS